MPVYDAVCIVNAHYVHWLAKCLHASLVLHWFAIMPFKQHVFTQTHATYDRMLVANIAIMLKAFVIKIPTSRIFPACAERVSDEWHKVQLHRRGDLK